MANTPRYALGRRAWGECARSGRRMLLREMVEDPRTGLLVDPAWAEPPPMRPATDIIDGIALDRVAPDLDAAQQSTVFYFGIAVDAATGDPMRPLCFMFDTGRPTIAVT